MFDDDAWQASPAVLGAEYAGLEEGEAAGPVFIATQRVGPQDSEARVELRKDDAGRLAMLGYSSHERLVAGAGESQPWVAVATESVYQVQQDCGADVVLWDIELPSALRHADLDEEGH